MFEPLYGDGEGKVDAEWHQDVGDGVHVLGEASEQCTLLLEEFFNSELNIRKASVGHIYLHNVGCVVHRNRPFKYLDQAEKYGITLIKHSYKYTRTWRKKLFLKRIKVW